MKTYRFDLKNFSSPRELCHELEQVQCKYYTYTFDTPTETIKHGKAADHEWMAGTWGNRVYRQAGGFPGWNGAELYDSNANKMREQLKEHFPHVTKDEVTVTVYDYTQELNHSPATEIDRVLLNEEDALVKEHKKKHGSAPKLNIQETKTRTRPMFDENFEEV